MCITTKRKNRLKRKNKHIVCPMCHTKYENVMGNGFYYMLHFTIGCEAANRY